MQTAEKISTENNVVKESTKPAKKTSRRFRFGCVFFVLFLLTICCGVVSVLWLAGYVQKYTCSLVLPKSQIWESLTCENYNLSTVGEGEYRYQEKTDQIEITSQEQLITSVVESASPSVVAIGIRGDSFSEDRVIGTGFVVTENGLIVTNRHVVEDRNAQYFVTLNESENPISVEKIHRDPINDIALITINQSGLKPLPLGDSQKLIQGQTVVAIGNPLGRFSGTVTSGIISGLNREVQISEGFFSSGVQTYEDVIQTDAAINPGNSGGPLLNTSAEVIGMNFATISGADNLSFAIPVNRIKDRIDELNRFGKFRIPYLGVEYRLRIVFVDGRSTVGAEILRVLSDSPAALAGITRGDIIIEFAGQDLENQSLFSLIQKSEIGSKVQVGIFRNRETFETTVTIAERE
ncbi:MAG: putative serine protease HtrA [candidate division WS6 bacterium OLB21]|uniref:Putative serine protease HtrA n=1 Tax=candidate division WS6 bacterium OLB21 TaxID=1617427 RepID=A0A136KJK9_9BACT|nr:MAG: putative serine protease HtrA [candidate division WS6 bacterium OLB21]